MLDVRENPNSIPSGSKVRMSYPQRPQWLWGLPTLPFRSNRDVLHGSIAARAWSVTIHRHLVLKLRISAAITLHPHKPLWHAHGYIYLYFPENMYDGKDACRPPLRSSISRNNPGPTLCSSSLTSLFWKISPLFSFFPTLSRSWRLIHTPSLVASHTCIEEALNQI